MAHLRRQDSEKEDQSADWVIAWRLIHGIDLGDRPPTEKEIRLAVWFLLDRGLSSPDIQGRTGLSKRTVVRIYDQRRLANQRTRPLSRRQIDARKLRPHWRHVRYLGGVGARPAGRPRASAAS